MKCELCGNEVDNLIVGIGKKVCQVCHDTLIKDDNNQGAYWLTLAIFSTFTFFIGLILGGWLL